MLYALMDAQPTCMDDGRSVAYSQLVVVEGSLKTLWQSYSYT